MNGQRDAAPWVGYTGGGCWHPDTNKHPQDGHRPRGMWANQAGFVYRVLKHAGDSGATAYFNKVRSYLLAHTTTPGINFKNTGKWCKSSYSIQGHQQWYGSWIRRLAVTYSWIKEDMSAADKAKFEDWLLAAGRYIIKHSEWLVGYAFSNQQGDSPTCDKQSCPGPRAGIIYDGGPTHYQMNDLWNNRVSVCASAAGIVGLVTGDTSLRDRGKNYFKGSLRHSVWPDGTYVDIIRTSQPQTAWGYPMDYLGSMCVLADALARAGDNSLYEYSTRAGSPAGTESRSGQPTKNIKLVTKHLARQVDGTIKKYGVGKPHTASNVINPYNTNGVGDGAISDLYMVQPNLYYKDDYIRSVYSRSAPGTHPRARNPANGWDYWTGDWGVLPDVEFMWDGLAGKVWPYGSTRGRKSLQYNTSPLCDSGQHECSAEVEAR